jgi:hypothetical protein
MIRTENIVHKFDPKLVKEQLAKKIKYYKEQCADQVKRANESMAFYKQCQKDGTVSRNFVREPTSAKFEKILYKEWIDTEINYYATVRVVELPTRSRKRFILVYGDVNNKTVERGGGTGPFDSLQKAFDWYLRGGR